MTSVQGIRPELEEAPSQSSAEDAVAANLSPHSRRRLGQARRAFVFGLVGGSGLLVNTAVMAIATGVGAHYLLGSLVSTQASTTWNYALSERFVFADGSHRISPLGRWIRFVIVNNLLLVARGPFIVLLTESAGIDPVASNALTLVATFVLRFALADRFIWGETSAADALGRVRITLLLVVVRARARPLLLAASGVAVFAFAAALRFWAVGAVGLNSDEAVYAGQGAALTGNPDLSPHFSIFRAHPLLLQLIVGIVFRFTEVSDVVARVVVVSVFGLGCVLGSYLLAARLYGRTVGLVSAAVIATLPYHVVVSRQVMVDTAMGLFLVLATWLFARYCTGDHDAADLVGCFVLLGAATLSKEIAVLGVVPVVATILWQRGWRVLRLGPLWFGLTLFVLLVAPFPLSRLTHQSDNASQFVLWQLFRDPNHSADYFVRVLLQYAGPVVLALVALGLLRMLRRRSTQDVLVLFWVGTFMAFFTIWPTKLFPYLFPILPGLAVMTALGLVEVVAVARRWNRIRFHGAALTGLAASLVVLHLGIGSASIVSAGPTARIPGVGDFDIEVQSFAGGREIGEWVGSSTPPNARFLTIGPSLGNILRFYGQRDSVALSVSADPDRSNPAYVPVRNPDLAIRNMDVQYAIWDAYSADRSSFYNARLMRYVRRYHGEPVYSAYLRPSGTLGVRMGAAPEDVDVRFVVYDLQGGNPRTSAEPVVDT